MQAMLRHRCAIERQPPTSEMQYSGAGEMVSPWEMIANDVACYIEPRSGRFRQAEYGRPQQVTHRIFFGIETDVQTGDRIVAGDTRYLVTFIADEVGHHLEADATQVIGV